MPIIKDTRGVVHKHYSDLVKAERRYAKADKYKAKAVTPVAEVPPVVPEVNTAEVKPPEATTDDIVIGDAEKKTVVRDAPAQIYYCLNCGEAVAKGDSVCGTCGIPLDWSSL